MRLVLDTSAFYYPRALRRIPRGQNVVVPAIVFTERARQLKRDGRATPSVLLRTLADRGWKVEPYREENALRAAHLAPADDAEWQELARDVLVAAHVREEDILLSANVADFVALGLPRARLRDPSGIV